MNASNVEKLDDQGGDSVDGGGVEGAANASKMVDKMITKMQITLSKFDWNCFQLSKFIFV